MEVIPYDVFPLIFNELEPKHASSCRSVCRSWKNL